MTAAISATSRPYSTAVAPLSRVARRRWNLVSALSIFGAFQGLEVKYRHYRLLCHDDEAANATARGEAGRLRQLLDERLVAFQLRDPAQPDALSEFHLE